MPKKATVKVTGVVGASLPRRPIKPGQSSWGHSRSDTLDDRMRYAYELEMGRPVPEGSRGGASLSLQWAYGQTIKGKDDKASILRGALLSDLVASQGVS